MIHVGLQFQSFNSSWWGKEGRATQCVSGKAGDRGQLCPARPGSTTGTRDGVYLPTAAPKDLCQQPAHHLQAPQPPNLHYQLFQFHSMAVTPQAKATWGGGGFTWLSLPGHSPSLGEVKGGTQAGVWRSHYGGMLLPDLLTDSCFLR